MVVAQAVEPQTYRWTRQEFYQLAEQGWFQDQRVMLIDGEIINMPVHKSGPYAAIDKSANALTKAFGSGFWIRTQAPLDLDEYSDSESDVSVVEGSREDYLDHHPSTAALIVEICDTTLRFDRGRKASLYARAGIADYWIVNLIDRQLEVHRNPVPDGDQPYGFGHSEVTIFKPTDSVAPHARPQAKISVAEFLP